MYLNIFKNMKKNGGFTLLEVIVTLTVAAVLGTIIYIFMGSNLSTSVQPILTVQADGKANAVMENITTDYQKLTSDDNELGTQVGLTTLQSHINSNTTPYYGAYTVVNNDFVILNSDGVTLPSTDAGSGSYRLLRVSIKQGNQTLTTLFAE